MKFFSIMLRSLCGAMLLAGAFQISADEISADAKRVEVGTRMLSKSEHASLQEKRAKEAEEASNNVPDFKIASVIPNAAASESKESRMAAINGVKIPSVNASTYITTHLGAYHSPASVSILGDSVILEDGSTWSVSSGDSYKTLNWLTSDILFITPNHEWFSIYDYCITNQNTGVSVRVNLVLGPLYNALFRHWIAAIDYSNYRVWLEDGSVWDLALGDFTAHQKWLVGDTVIIGINDGWFNSYNPNILINVNMANYSRSICVQN